ncbi:hypothetical protein Tco_0475589 [Tanacetum coccineum]
MVDDLLSTKIRYATRTALESYTKELEKKAQEERKLYIDVVEKSVKDIIKDEVKSLLPQTLPKEVSDFATPMIQSTITDSLKNVVLAKSSSQPQSTYEAAASFTEFELKKILLDKLEKSKSYRAAEEHKNLYDALIQSYQLDKDLFDSYGSNIWLLVDLGIVSFGLMVVVVEILVLHLVGPTFNLLKGTCKSRVELEYHFKECYKAVTDHLDWTNPEGHQYPFDLSKLLPLIKVQGRQVVPADYFINNDLEYLKGGSLSRKYTTSTTKTKATKYDTVEGIEDMGPKRQRYYGFARHIKSTHDVYSRKRIIAVTHGNVMKKYNYGSLEEIEVRRDDNTLHKFKEGDFLNLNLRDIEDMLLLLVQKKISNLERDVIFDLNVALQIFTRSIVILKRVEDLQLGVESY